MVDAPGGLQLRRMELGGQIQRWRWCSHGGADRRLCPVAYRWQRREGNLGGPAALVAPPSPYWLRRWWLCGERSGFWSMEVLNGGVRRGGLEGLRPRQLPPPHSPPLLTATAARWLQSTRRRWRGAQRSARGSLGG
jgi:hypothetical protein